MKTLLRIGLVVTATAVLAGVLAMAAPNVAFAPPPSFSFGGGIGGSGGSGTGGSGGAGACENCGSGGGAGGNGNGGAGGNG